MPITRKTLICCLSVIFFTSPVFAENAAGTTAFNFLKMPFNAQVASMAGISSLFVSASVSNPSMIPSVEKPVLSAAYASHFQDVNYNSLSFTSPFKNFGINVSYAGMNYGKIDSYIEDSSGNYLPNGSFDANDAYVSIGLGKEIFRDVSLGISVKYVWQKIYDSSIAGAAFNFSGAYIPGNADTTWYVSGGFENVGADVEGYPLPSSFYIDFVNTHEEEPFIYALGIKAYFDNTVWLKAAGEYAFNEMFFLRAGYSLPVTNDNESLGELYQRNLSFGFGFEYGFVSIDYAWLPFGDLGNTNMFSLNISF
ncbi:MAG: hypothetical protein FWD54_02825 [Endomicrobia bacterium]|nr:hypothetical protein [Endomicrobiia bacterium]MCL2799198.1 hypothetical protein [Endomicrobiia bacterium]